MSSTLFRSGRSDASCWKLCASSPALGKSDGVKTSSLSGVLDQLPQRAGIGGGQTLHGLPAMRPCAVGEGNPEPALGHEAADLQRMGAVGARAPARTGGGRGGLEERALVEAGVDLAQVVEQDLGRSRFEETGRPQQAVADAAAGHGAQPLPGAREGGARIGVSRLQDDRVHRGEPAHGARDV